MYKISLKGKLSWEVMQMICFVFLETWQVLTPIDAWLQIKDSFPTNFQKGSSITEASCFYLLKENACMNFSCPGQMCYPLIYSGSQNEWENLLCFAFVCLIL